MSGEDEFWNKYWSTPELEAQEMPTRRCRACSRITWVNFRADSVTDELFRSRTLLIGDFLYVVESAFAECYVCRIIMIHVLQSLTHVSQMISCYDIIKKVGLRLSLDDELSLHCWDGEGRRVVLSDLAVAGVIELGDKVWDESKEKVDEANDEENLRGGLYWDRNEATGLIRLLDCGKSSEEPSSSARRRLTDRR